MTTCTPPNKLKAKEQKYNSMVIHPLWRQGSSPVAFLLLDAKHSERVRKVGRGSAELSHQRPLCLLPVPGEGGGEVKMPPCQKRALYTVFKSGDPLQSSHKSIICCMCGLEGGLISRQTPSSIPYLFSHAIRQANLTSKCVGRRSNKHAHKT